MKKITAQTTFSNDIKSDIDGGAIKFLSVFFIPLVESTVSSGDKFGLILYWRSLKFAESNYTVFVHAVGPDQVMRGQWDSVPVQGSSPTGGWVPGEIIEDYYEIPMVEDAPPWKYDIFVGMYDSFTGERLSLSSLNAPVSDNRVWLSRVQVEEK